MTDPIVKLDLYGADLVFERERLRRGIATQEAWLAVLVARRDELLEQMRQAERKINTRRSELDDVERTIEANHAAMRRLGELPSGTLPQ